MKEYWVNVYPQPWGVVYGPRHDARPWWNKDAHYGKIGYRIHVKMKEVNGFKRDYPFKFLNQGAEGGRAVVAVGMKPSYPMKYERKAINGLNWMG